MDLGDLSYLLKPAYSAAMQRQLAEAQPISVKGSRLPEMKPGEVYLVPYVIEEYSQLAWRLRVWPYPRGHHQFVASIPYK